MPRNRTVKPEFWNDEKLGQEPESVMLTFIGLWNFSDDYGVVRANPTWLKNQIFPYKDNLRIGTFSLWLKRLAELEAIILFTYRGESFYCIRTFRKHQYIEKPTKARNCPEEELISILKAKGFVLNEDKEFVQSGSSRGVVGEDSPPDIGIGIGNRILTGGEDGKGEPKEEKIAFSQFWDTYGKKVDTVKCKKIWEGLSQPVRQEIMNMLPNYLAATPDLQYRKRPLTFLHGRVWEDEAYQTAAAPVIPLQQPLGATADGAPGMDRRAYLGLDD